jgi:uracil-DNA glycosylase
MQEYIPDGWKQLLATELEKPYFELLEKFVEGERRTYTIFPPKEETFTALQLTSYENIRVLLLGQDPYPTVNHAHGLCFSVKPGIKPPQSLVNIYKELKEDVGFQIPNNGYLAKWAQQGILMLNAVLTVRETTPNSHKDKGWEQFTDAIIKKVNEKSDPVVFILWGAYAQKKIKLIDTNRHFVIQSAHPSPLSAKTGFFGSKPFSKTNQLLQSAGKPPIDWQIPNL